MAEATAETTAQTTVVTPQMLDFGKACIAVLEYNACLTLSAADRGDILSDAATKYSKRNARPTRT